MVKGSRGGCAHADASTRGPGLAGAHTHCVECRALILVRVHLRSPLAHDQQNMRRAPRNALHALGVDPLNAWCYLLGMRKRALQVLRQCHLPPRDQGLHGPDWGPARCGAMPVMCVHALSHRCVRTEEDRRQCDVRQTTWRTRTACHQALNLVMPASREGCARALPSLHTSTWLTHQCACSPSTARGLLLRCAQVTAPAASPSGAASSTTSSTRCCAMTGLASSAWLTRGPTLTAGECVRAQHTASTGSRGHAHAV